jgi:hypothetical protein
VLEKESALCERECERIARACLGGNAAQLITFPAQIMRACALYACVPTWLSAFWCNPIAAASNTVAINFALFAHAFSRSARGDAARRSVGWIN